MGDKPLLVLILCGLGGLIIFLFGIISIPSLLKFSPLFSISGLIGILCGAALMYSAFEMYKSAPDDMLKFKKFSRICLVATFLSIFNFGGFVIGFLIALVGFLMSTMYQP